MGNLSNSIRIIGFDIASRGYSHFSYLGIYKSKAVRYIGSVENVIVANWTNNKGLDILDSRHEVSEEQKMRLKKVIRDGLSMGWNLDKDHRFFYLTNFILRLLKKIQKAVSIQIF